MIQMKQPGAQRVHWATSPLGEGTRFRRMGIGQLGAKAASFWKHADGLKRLSTAKLSPSDQYPLSHFQEFARLNNFPLGTGNEDEVRIIETHETGGKICASGTEIILPDETRRMIARSAERFNESPALMVREAEENLDFGAGPFDTKPVVLKGTFQEKCAALEQAVISVYMSWYSNDGAAYCGRHGSRGMGLLIEPVVGEVIEHNGEKFIMPAFSGTAYTNFEGNAPLIRVVAGLGTAAVAGDGMLINPDEWDGKPLAIKNQEFAHAISLRSGKIGKIPLASHALKDFRFNPENLFWAIMDIREWGKEYVEWSCLGHGGNQNTIFLNQLADDRDDAPVQPGKKSRKGKWVKAAEGDDCLNKGERECKGIVYVTPIWNMRVKAVVDAMGALMDGHLLVVDQTPLMNAAEGSMLSLTYASICNCAGVWEYSTLVDSRHNTAMAKVKGSFSSPAHGEKAATHFAGICKSEKILFVSAGGDTDILLGSGDAIFLKDYQRENDLALYIINASARLKHNEATGRTGVWINMGDRPYSDKNWAMLGKKAKLAVEKIGIPEGMKNESRGSTDIKKITASLDMISDKIDMMFNELNATAESQGGYYQVAPFNGQTVDWLDSTQIRRVAAAISYYAVRHLNDNDALPTPENMCSIKLSDMQVAIRICSASPECVASGAVAHLQGLYGQMKAMPEWNG